MNKAMSLILYICVFVVSGACLGLCKCKNNVIKKIGLGGAVLLPSFLAAIRYDVGTDYLTYNSIFSTLREYSWKEVVCINVKWEMGFKILVKGLACIGNNKFIFGMLSFLTLAIVIYTLQRDYNQNDISSMFIIYLFFFFWNAFNIVRQSLAIAIVFSCYRYIFENKRSKYILGILIATSIHVSALIALPVYWLYNHKAKRAITVENATIIIGIFAIFIGIWRNILKLILLYNWGFGKKFFYLLHNNDNAMNRDIYVKLVITILVWILYKKYAQLDKRNILFIYMYTLALIVGFTGYYITSFKRLTLYFEIVSIILLGQLLKMFSKGASRYIVKRIIVFGCIGYFILVGYILGRGEIFPYKWR